MRARLDLRDAARPDRLLDLLDGRVAHRLPRREALAQALVGDVAVAVVRRLRQDGQDQLVERLLVRRHDRHAVDLAQAVADRGHAAPVGRRHSAGGSWRRATRRRTLVVAARVDVAEHTAELDGQPVFWRSAPVDERRSRRPSSTSTASRRAATTGCRSWQRTGGLAPDLLGFGRSGKGGQNDYSLEGIARFVERFLDEVVELERVRLVVHDWGAAALAFAQRHPGADRAARDLQRRAAAARLPLAPRRAAVAHAASSASWRWG